MDDHLIPLDLSIEQARRLLGLIRRDYPERIFYTHHAEQRMVERQISRSQVERCLEHGIVIEGPYRDVYGNWKMTLELLTAGDLIRVVAVLDQDDQGLLCLIITTY